MRNKLRKPRELHTGFWDGFAEWCDWNEDTELNVNLKLSNATPGELRRMANWMLKAADYAEWKKKQKTHRDAGKE